MALPINIEQLLDATTVESSRIEYKAGWNPDAIYRSICAVRPAKGLDIARIDSIEKEMIGFNNLRSRSIIPRQASKT